MNVIDNLVGDADETNKVLVNGEWYHNAEIHEYDDTHVIVKAQTGDGNKYVFFIPINQFVFRYKL